MIVNFLLNLFKMTCRDTTPLLSELQDGPVSFTKLIRIKIHLAICEVCRYYKRQLEALSAIAAKLGEEDSAATSDITLPQESKGKIKKFLEENSNN
jgi:predicted anti-sigma-YlaC factor YlaD